MDEETIKARFPVNSPIREKGNKQEGTVTGYRRIAGQWRVLVLASDGKEYPLAPDRIEPFTPGPRHG